MVIDLLAADQADGCGPQSYQHLLSMMKTHWIGGKACASKEAAEIPVVNPATEETIDTIPQGCDEDVEAAVDAAQDAMSAWAAMAPVERRSFFWKIAEKIQQHQPEIARLLTMENGKPYKRSLWEAGRLKFCSRSQMCGTPGVSIRN